MELSDFDIRTTTLKATIDSFVQMAYPDKNDDEKNAIARKTFDQKHKIITVWSSIKLKIWFHFMVR